jgi:hypothetical protein
MNSQVLGGASIGHTDPYRVIEAVEARLGPWLVPGKSPLVPDYDI